ncbi:MAG: LPS assembly lipoprotein LptE [Cellvibrio sp.]
MKRIIVSCLIAFTLSACGWHIRGAIDLPKDLSQLYISAVDSKGALMTELRQLLRTNRVSIVDDESQANYSLNIIKETKERRSAGVGGEALSSAYELTLKAVYEIKLKNSLEVTNATAISVRNFNYNTDAINSATQQEILLDQEMRRELAQQMLRRLNAVITNPPVEKNKPAENKPNDATSGIDQNGKAAP